MTSSKIIGRPLLLIFSWVFFAACNNSDHKESAVSKSHVTGAQLPGKKAFQQTISGKETGIYFLENKNKLTAAITNYGARLVSLLVPDKNGSMVDVVLGFDSLQQYIHARGPYFGATIGRYANRIEKGRFDLNGTPYQLDINNGENLLHGGSTGFHTRVWNVGKTSANSIELSYVSEDGEEGFPGRLHVTVTYVLTDKNELEISYTASTDKPTIINLTNHSFFNLNGQNSGDITDHLLTINADKFTPVNKSLVVTGEQKPVENTPFDFRREIKIGRHINDTDVQLQFAGGYDHNFVVNKDTGTSVGLAATVLAPRSGIFMEVFTTEPCVQFFTANSFKGLDFGKGGKPITYRSAFCLETQHFPNSPNVPSFPSTVLQPGKTFNSATVYKFSLKYR